MVPPSATRSSTTPGSTTRPRRVLVPDLQRRQPDDCRPRRRRRHAGRHRSASLRSFAIPRRVAGWRESCTRFFVSEVDSRRTSGVNSIAGTFSDAASNMKRWSAVLRSPEFQRSVDILRALFLRRWSSSSASLKEVGWTGFSVDDALTPLVNMGQQLFEPPDVNGWDRGRGWFSTGAMLARMNFASALDHQPEVRAARLRPSRSAKTPDSLLASMLDRLYGGHLRQRRPIGDAARLSPGAGATWTGSTPSSLTKARRTRASVARVVGEYQLV